MRKPSLLAAALLALSATPTLAGTVPNDGQVYLHGSGFNLSFIESFLGDRGVHVDLPEVRVDLPQKAKSAVANALERASNALDRVFGDGGTLDGVFDGTHTNIDNTVNDAISNARSVLDGFDLPEVSLPDVGGLFESAREQAEDALAGLEDILPPNTQQSVDSALEQVFGDGGVLDNIDDLVPAAHHVLDDLDVGGVLDDMLGEGGVVDRALSDLPLDRLPEAATEAFGKAAGVVEQVLGDLLGQHDHSNGELSSEIATIVSRSVDPIVRSSAFVTMPATSSSASIPEPTAGVLLLAGLTIASVQRRRS